MATTMMVFLFSKSFFNQDGKDREKKDKNREEGRRYQGKNGRGLTCNYNENFYFWCEE